jgi:hypothetical protein
MEKKKFWNDLPLLVIASLTLGLAPFIPEPHIWGKIKWIAGGANGMQLMDWLDFAMHGIPWMLLIRVLILMAIQRAKNTPAG